MPCGCLAKAARRARDDDDLVLDVLVHLRNAHQSASLPYCSSVTCSSQVTTWPSCFSAMAMWLIAQFGDAPLPANGASTRTVPVKYSAGPFTEFCDPARLISMTSIR